MGLQFLDFFFKLVSGRFPGFGVFVNGFVTRHSAFSPNSAVPLVADFDDTLIPRDFEYADLILKHSHNGRNMGIQVIHWSSDSGWVIPSHLLAQFKNINPEVYFWE